MRTAIFREVFRQVADSMRTNRLRAILSTLGVAVGIFFVIIVGYFLNGLNLTLEKTFSIIGADMMYVDKYDWSGGKSWRLTRQRKSITMEQAEELIDRVKLADLAVPVVRYFGAGIKYGSEHYTGLVAMGTYSGYSQTSAGEVLKGRFFSPFEDQRGENVIVLGYKVYKTVFPNGDAVGKTVKIEGHKFKVIGVIKKRGVLFIDFIDNQCFMPLKTFNKVYGDYNRSISVAVKAGSELYMDEVRSEVRGAMREIRNLKPWEEDDFSINETAAFEKNINELRYWVGGIGFLMSALSFFVGIIGIMNIMFVSVAERTREIGIRKAIGANRFSILLQFLGESVFLCFIGAMFAFLASSAIILIAAKAIPVFVPELDFLPEFLPFTLFLIATAVSFFVGIVAGIIPAYRAANLNPVDALRYE